MVFNRLWLAAACAAVSGTVVLAGSSPATAQQYSPGEFFKLDLSKAVLSPKPLGPATTFTPGPLGVTVDRGNSAAQTNAELVVDPKSVPAAAVHIHAESEPVANAGPAKNITAPRRRVAHARVEPQPVHKPRALVALHGRNPMEAQARDTSIQTWPCRSGGICNWKR
jgi:hypothetical protein